MVFPGIWFIFGGQNRVPYNREPVYIDIEMSNKTYNVFYQFVVEVSCVLFLDQASFLHRDCAHFFLRVPPASLGSRAEGSMAGTPLQN